MGEFRRKSSPLIHGYQELLAFEEKLKADRRQRERQLEDQRGQVWGMGLA